jgi:methyltransferase (TIGR00027 family)
MTIATRPSDPLGATARWTAAVRAGEQARPDRLVEDPWAERLAGDDGMAWLGTRAPASVLPIVIRTRFFDDWLRSVMLEGPVRQVVLLAAGLDTRAWRLPWPAGTRLFELDRGALLAFKAAEIARAAGLPACERLAVDADLAGDWGTRLVDAGFDPATPAAWLAEGVLFYLPDPVVAHVLDTASALATPGSRLAFDIVNRAVLSSPYTRAWIEMQAAAGAPWIGAMDDPATELLARGWTAAVAQPGEPGVSHGRWTLPVIPAAMADLPHSWYVTARRDAR